jgi:EmrB/QacA subfamily drug resistance transporter
MAVKRFAGQNVVLAAMIVAVSMTFIDQTIIALAIPQIQRELHLTQSGVQWVINGYVLALAASFMVAGKFADSFGHRKMVLFGTFLFAASSAACGFTPVGSYSEAWIIGFRCLQGIGAAFLFSAALALVIATIPLAQRGFKLAIFFAITGAMTGIGPILGGYLTQWTWRAVFWVNIPVAVLALILILISDPVDEIHRVPIDWRGTILVAAGMLLSVFGFQHSSTWGWVNVKTIGCIVAGLLILAVFALMELRTKSPLINLRIFRVRAFLVENLILFFASMVFVSLFFFASLYAQISLLDSPSQAGLYILIFFIGFAPAAMRGGKIMDKFGAKGVVVIGAAVATIGFFLWSQKLPGLSSGNQWWAIIIAGAGMGLIIGPASTDASNRSPRETYGEVTGIIQTVRYYGSSVGLAVLGTILIQRTASGGSYYQEAASLSGRLDFAHGMKDVFTAMAIIMAVCFVIAIVGLRKGIQTEIPDLASTAAEGQIPPQ